MLDLAQRLRREGGAPGIQGKARNRWKKTSLNRMSTAAAALGTQYAYHCFRVLEDHGTLQLSASPEDSGCLTLYAQTDFSFSKLVHAANRTIAAYSVPKYLRRRANKHYCVLHTKKSSCEPMTIILLYGLLKSC